VPIVLEVKPGRGLLIFREDPVMPKSFRCRLLVERTHDVAVIRFADSTIDAEDIIRAIAEELNLVAEHFGPGKLLLDFHNVQLMSGRMLAVLLWFVRKVERGHGSVKLCCITPHLHDHFRITQLHHYFEIYSERSIALNAFRQHRPSLCTL
jgi:anti-anti-sigma factor